MALAGGALLGCGGSTPPPPPPPPPTVSLNIRFTTLEVLEDKEEGKGDWRVTLHIDGQPLGEPVTGEAGSGASVPIDRATQTSGPLAEHAVIITAKIEEYDGGFDNTWELIGERTETYDKTNDFGVGGQVFEMHTPEGHVRLHFVVARAKP